MLAADRIDEILESLDLSRAQPGIGFLEALFDRFNARVPFESASKILRDAEFADPAQKPRRPEVFWNEHLERGAGGTCFDRVAAFATLLTEIGFDIERLLGKVQRDGDHAALAVRQGGKTWICDVGFPLPGLFAAAGLLETPLGPLEVGRTARGWSVEWERGVPEGPRSLEIFDTPPSASEFEAFWQATFRSGSRFLSRLGLRRQSHGRVLAYSGGEIRVDDRHTRLSVPLTANRLDILAEKFEIDADLLGRALAIVDDVVPERRAARLTAYLESSRTGSAAFDAIANVTAYQKLQGGVAEITSTEGDENRWRLTLCPPVSNGPSHGAALIEEVVVDRQRRELRIRRAAAARSSESAFRVEEHYGKTFLVREAYLAGSEEELLRNDGLRGRLAGTLAVDLLAWARQIPG